MCVPKYISLDTHGRRVQSGAMCTEILEMVISMWWIENISAFFFRPFSPIDFSKIIKTFEISFSLQVLESFQRSQNLRDSSPFPPRCLPLLLPIAVSSSVRAGSKSRPRIFFSPAAFHWLQKVPPVPSGPQLRPLNLPTSTLFWLYWF